MLSLNLNPIFKARGIEKPYSFLVKAGLSPHSANIILNSSTRVFKLDHIELLCTALVCEPNDLLLFTPEKDKIYTENNPLLKLKHQEADNNWQDTFAAMPFKQLKEVTKEILGKSKPRTEEK